MLPFKEEVEPDRRGFTRGQRPFDAIPGPPSDGSRAVSEERMDKYLHDEKSTLHDRDYYECPSKCGTFQHRQRTRMVRLVS